MVKLTVIASESKSASSAPYGEPSALTDIVRLNGPGGLLSPRALYLRHNFLTLLAITKQRDTKAAYIPEA